MTALAGIVFRDLEPGRLLDTVAHLAIESGPPGAAGAWLQLEDAPGLPPATDPLAELAGRTEVELGEGPCLSAWHEGRSTRLNLTDGECDWPRWKRALASEGVASTVAVPLVADGEPVGAVGLHAPMPLDDLHTVAMQLFGDMAGALIVNFRAFVRARQLADQLTEALGTRDLIGTAKGILMERETIDEDAAFALLKAASQRSNRKLREIAHALVRPGARSL